MEPKKQRTRKSMKGVKNVFVLSSLAVALSPTLQVIILPSRPWGEHDFLMSTYMRPTGSERQRASKMREKQILSEIREIRNRIRIKAEKYVTPEGELKVAYTASQKKNIHCMKLIYNISDQIALNNIKKQEERNENNVGRKRKVAVNFNSLKRQGKRYAQGACSGSSGHSGLREDADRNRQS